MGAALFGIFGLLALVLASVGIYGVMAYNVAQGTNEIGIRMAMGARPADVLSLVLRHGMRLAGIGIVAGAVCGIAVTRLLQNLMFSVRAYDPVTHMSVSAMIAAVAFVAGWLLSRRRHALIRASASGRARMESRPAHSGAVLRSSPEPSNVCLVTRNALHGSHLSEKRRLVDAPTRESWADDLDREVWRTQSECTSWRLALCRRGAVRAAIFSMKCLAFLLHSELSMCCAFSQRTRPSQFELSCTSC